MTETKIKLEKAKLIEIVWDDKNPPDPLKMVGEGIDVQFNPQTLKLTYSNQLSGGDKSGKSSKQFVGRGTTKLSLDLWFDVTYPFSDPVKKKDDVRLLTKEVVDFMTPKKEIEKNQFVPPGVRFIWGTFMFDGIIESINENLEFFSEDGKPLRASISLSIGSQEIQFHEPPAIDIPGTLPLHQAKEGEDIQKIASKIGIQDWKSVAMASGIENPRFIPPGTWLNLNKANKQRLKQ